MGSKEKTLNYRQGTEPYDPATPPPYAKKVSSAEIERDIEYTRHHMDGIFDEMGSRFHPRELAGDVVDFFTGREDNSDIARARRAVIHAEERIVDSFRHDPLPIGLIAAGVIIMASHHHHDGQSVSGDGRRNAGEKAEELGRKSQGAFAKAQDTVKELAHSAGEKLSGAREQAGERSGQAGEKLSEASEHARERARQARQRGQQDYQKTRSAIVGTVRDHPLSVGFAALGLGLAAGLLPPLSKRERETMHEPAQKARKSADDISASALSAAEREAREEGIAPEQKTENAEGQASDSIEQQSAKEKIAGIARESKEAAEREAKQKREEQSGL